MAKRARSNAIDEELIRAVVGHIEGLLDQLDSERAGYMAKCAVLREDMADVYVDARDKGINRKALKAVIRSRVLERKKKAAVAKLDIDELSIFEQLSDVLGDFADLPLGEAALQATARAEPR